MSAQTPLGPWPATWSEKMLYGLCTSISWSFRILPRKVQLALGDVFGEFCCLLAGDRRRVVLDNLLLAFPEMSKEERQKMLHRHFRHLGRMIIEYVLSLTLKKAEAEDWMVIENSQILEKALEGGKGALVLSAHMGSCDFGMILAALKADFPFVLIGKRTRVRWVTRLLFGLREIHGVGALPEERVIMDIFRSLKKNKLVVFVMDQYMGPPQGIATKFFGHETGGSQGLAIFAEKTKVPVIPMWTFRRSDGRIQLMIDSPMELEGLSVAEMTQKFSDKIEEMVRRNPEQWFWVHKRWKKFSAIRD